MLFFDRAWIRFLVEGDIGIADGVAVPPESEPIVVVIRPLENFGQALLLPIWVRYQGF